MFISLTNRSPPPRIHFTVVPSPSDRQPEKYQPHNSNGGATIRTLSSKIMRTPLFLIDGRCSQAGLNSPNDNRHLVVLFCLLFLLLSSTPLSVLLSLAQFGCQWSSYKKRGAGLPFLLPLHDDPRLWDRLVDGFVRQHVGTVQVKLVVHDHILPQHRHVLHANLTTQNYPEVIEPPITSESGLLPCRFTGTMNLCLCIVLQT